MLTLNFNPFPVLETERLVLRQVTVSDAAEVLFLRSDAEVMKYIDRKPAASLQDAIDFINRIKTSIDANEAIQWGITIKGNDQLVGIIGIWQMQKENYRGEIGYVIHPTRQRKGFMTEAIKKVLEYGFNTINLHSIEANTNVENKASQKLLESVGFRQEAWFRENYYFNGKFLDSAIYCLLAPKK